MFQVKWEQTLKLAAMLLLCSGCVSSGTSGDTTALAPADPILKVNHEKAARLNAELGVAYLEKGQIARAKSKLLRARELAPQLPEVHYTMGYFLEFVGDIDEAEVAYQRALSITPKSGEANNNYGTFLCRRKQYLQADKYFQIALEDKDYVETAGVYENAGMCMAQTKNQEQAKEYFLKATRYDPSRPLPWLELSYMSLEADDVQSARFYFERYEQLPHSPDPRGLFMKHQLARQVGDENAAASAALLLRSQFPMSKETIAIEPPG